MMAAYLNFSFCNIVNHPQKVVTEVFMQAVVLCRKRPFKYEF